MTREDALGLLNSLIVMNQEIKRRETFRVCCIFLFPASRVTFALAGG